MRLSWQAVEDLDLAGYALLRSEDAAAEFTFLPGRGPGGATITTGKTSYVDSLHSFPGRTFFYRVAAVDTSRLQSEPSGFVGATVLEDKVAPEPPRSLAAIPDESEPRVTLVWTPPVRDAGGGELSGLAGYAILRREPGSGGTVPVDTVAAETRQYVDDGLKALTSYSYSIVAFDGAGNTSSLSQVVQVTTPGMPVPANLAAESRAGRIEVSWAAVSDEELLGYDLYRSERPDELFERLPGTEGTPFTTGRTSYVDTSVVAGRPYYYKVQSVGRTHRSELSVFVDGEALADEVPPESPRNLSAVADGSEFGRVSVTWNVPLVDDDGGELTGLSGYRVFRSQGTTDSFVQVAAVSEARYEDSGLEESTTYFYTVSAVDGSGNESGRAAAVRVKTQGEDRVSPAVPRNVSAVSEAGFSDRIAVRWSAPTTDADGGDLTGLSGFTVYRSEGVSGSLVAVSTVGSEAREYVDAGLRALTEYGYAVSAFDGSGNESGQSAVSRARTEGIAVPSGVRAADGIGRIEVNWAAVSDEELLGYDLYRSERPDELFERLPGTEGTPFTTGRTSYVDTSVVAGRPYYYKVQSVGRTHRSELSSQVGAEALADEVSPGVPRNVSAVSEAGFSDRITVRWSAPTTDADGGDLTGLSGFTVYRSEGVSGSLVAVSTVGSEAREYVDEGLRALTEYGYAVSAFDGSGNESGQSAVSRARTEGIAVPSGVRAADGIGRIEVNWAAVSDEELLGYDLYRSERPDELFERLPGTEGTPFTTGRTSYVDTSVVAGRPYYYKVQSVGRTHRSELSVFVDGEALADEVPPESPRNLSAVADGSEFGRVSVTWNVPLVDDDGGELTGLSGYRVFRSQGTTDSFVQVAAVSEARYEDSGLEESTTYFYTVSAVDGSGNESGRAAAVRVKTQGEDRVSPAVPRNVSAVSEAGFSDRIAVRWSAPTTDADGGDLTGLSGFTVYRSEGVSGSLVAVSTVGSEAREYVDEGLRALTEYGYAVSAFDGSGNESGQSAVSRARTEGIAVPSGVRAADGIGRIEVSWEAVSDEELLGYDVYRSERPDELFERLPGTEGTPFTTGRTSYVDTSVVAGRPYYYKVQSVGRTHRSELSSQVGAEALADEVSPAVPRNVSAVSEAGFSDRIAVRWSAPTTDADGGDLTGLSGFTVYRSEEVSGSLVAVSTVGSEAREYVDEGLRALTEYGYAVSAFDGSGNESGQSAVSRARTEGIAVPSGVRARDGIGRIEVSWEAVSDEKLIGYNVYRSSRPDLEFELLGSVTGASFTTARTSYVDSNLVSGARYYYKVSSVSSAFESELSGYVSGESQPDVSAPEPPGGVVATALEEGVQVRLSWRASQHDADGGELTGLQGYVIFRSSEGSSELVAVDTVSAGTTEYVDAGLEAAVVYSYALMAVDASGNASGLTSPVSTRTPGLSPPSGLSAVSGIGRITVTWAGSAESDLIGFNVYRSERPDELFERLPGTEGTPFTTGRTSYVDTSVVAGRPYYYKVQSVGRTHRSELSVFVDGEALADEVPPESPRNLSAVADGSEFGRVSVTWNVPLVDDDGGELTGLSGYRVFRSQGTTDSFVQVAAVSEARYEDSGLEESTTYFYTVSAVDGSGNESGRAAAVRVKTQGEDRVSPAVPRNVSAVSEAGFSDRIAVRWSAPTTDADGGDLTGLSGFTVYRSEGVSGSLVAVSTVGSEAREYVDAGLRALTEYGYAVSAFDGSGNESGQSAVSRARTEGIAVPSGVRAADGIGRIEVSWAAVSDEELLGYDLYRSERPDELFERLPGTEGTPFTTGRTSYVDTSVVAGRPYYYKVQSVGRTHRSELSSQVGAEALADEVSPAVPRNVSAVSEAGFSDRIAVRWSAPTTDADGGDLTGLSGFTVYRSEGVSGSLVAVSTVGSEAREYVDAGLRALTEYGYAVSAFDGSGNESGQSAVSRARTEGIAVPSGVRAADGIGRIEVSWEAVSDEELLGYDVYRSERPDELFERLPGTEGTPFTTGRTSYVDTSVVAGRPYYYKVQSVGRTHRSELSSQVGAEALADEVSPAVPRNVSAVSEAGFSDRIAVRWSAPTTDADGGDLTGLSGFTVYRSEEVSGSLVAVSTVGSEAREYVDEGLRALTEYGYAVSAFDGSGNESGQSAVSRARTEGIAVPSGVRARDGIGRIEVSWEAVSDEKLIGYNVYRSSRPDLEFELLGSVTGASFTTARTSYVDSNLVSGARYYYKVSSVSSAFESELSGYVSGESQPDVSAPEPPGGVVATALEEGVQVRLSWRASQHDADGGELTGLQGYVIFRSSEGSSELVAVDTVSAGTTEYVDAGLEAAVVYSYALMAVDASGNASGLTSPVSTRTPGLSPPSGLSAVSGIGRITVTWAGSAESDLIGFNVYRSERPDELFERLPGTEGTPFTTGQTTYVDTGFVGGEVFFYRVSVVTSQGESGLSEFDGATVETDSRPPAAPTFLSGEAVVGDPEVILLEWRAPSSDFSGAELTGLSGYLVFRADSPSGPFREIGSSETAEYRDSGLEQRTTYYYQIQALDPASNASAPSETESATTSGVDIPKNVSLSSTTPSDLTKNPVVTIRWEASAGVVLRYEVERTTVPNSTDDPDYTAIPPASGIKNDIRTSREDDTVERGVTYYYRVRAVDAESRESDWTMPLAVKVSE